jgi:hypothetical protein
MDMICQHLTLDQLDPAAFARTEHSDSHLRRRARVNARHAIPRVPRDVRVHLECSVSRQGVLTPGASPGLIREVRVPISNQNPADRIKKTVDL